jgi:transcriptional regulator of acetoin/glycerol metabolism
LESPIAAAAEHADRVLTVAEDRENGAGDDEFWASWERCVGAHRVDPASAEAPRILTGSEVKELREPLAELLASAQDELDRLFKVVRRARYVTLVCDRKGVAVEHRGDPAEADQFKYWGTWLGGVWSEEAEGTNGIGTCLVEARSVTIHQGQHFRARHISLSCSGTPIFDPAGNLIAVLDVSSIDPELSEASHALTGALTEAAARAIGERAFRERFRRDWIVAIAQPDATDQAMMFAVDRDQRIVGADRNARLLLARDNHRLDGRLGLWAVFERHDAIFRNRHGGDVQSTLRPIGTAETWPALITPPASTSRIWESLENRRLHARPRLDAIAAAPQLILPHTARGGLPPQALRRAQEFIEAHIDENITLTRLAEVTGLSLFHFARAFKQSEGVTPHAYLLQRRVARAQKLLTGTDLPLSKIALATGFSDQSHLARHFRAQIGVAPGAFRRSTP